MRQINLVEGKVVAPEGMKVGIVAARTGCCRGTEDRDGTDCRMVGLKQQRNVGYISAGIGPEIQRSGECDRGRFHGQADQEAPGSVVSGIIRDLIW